MLTCPLFTAHPVLRTGASDRFWSLEQSDLPLVISTISPINARFGQMDRHTATCVEVVLPQLFHF